MATDFTGESVEASTRSAFLEASGFNLRPTGALAESFSRMNTPTAAQTLTSAQPVYTAIQLLKGQVVTNLTFWSAATALATGTHQLFGLADSSFKTLASSADATSAAWSANSSKSLAMTTPYTVPADGVYYAVVAISASTVPTLAGVTTILTLAAATPPVAFTDTANATTTAFVTTGTNSAGFAPLYCYVS